MKLTKKQQKELKEIKEIIKDDKKYYSMDIDKRSEIWKKKNELQHIDNLENVRFRLKNDDHK